MYEQSIDTLYSIRKRTKEMFTKSSRKYIDMIISDDTNQLYLQPCFGNKPNFIYISFDIL